MPLKPVATIYFFMETVFVQLSVVALTSYKYNFRVFKRLFNNVNLIIFLGSS